MRKAENRDVRALGFSRLAVRRREGCVSAARSGACLDGEFELGSMHVHWV
jgi:hypothetical protein